MNSQLPRKNDLIKELAELRQNSMEIESALNALQIAGEDSLSLIEIDEVNLPEPAEAQIKRQNLILEGINRILQAALTSETEESLGKTCLEVAQQLTQSKFGFINLISETGCFDVIAISDPGWEACRMNRGTCLLPRGLEIRGIRGRTIKDAKSMFTNDPASHPDFIGLPEGHPPLSAFLGTPLIQDGQVIGLIGLGNKTGGYDDLDAENLEKMSHSIVQSLMRKRTESALRNSEQLYRNLFENNEDAFFIVEPIYDGLGKTCDVRFIRTNQNIAKQTGQIVSMVEGKRITEVFPDIEPYWLRMCDKVLEIGKPLHYENYNESTRRWYNILYFPYSPGQVGVLLTDVSSRKHMEEDLNQSEKRFRALVTSSSELLYRLSPDWKEMLQLNSQGFLVSNESSNRNWLNDYVPKEDQQSVLAAVAAAINAKSIYEFEHRVITADSNIGWIWSRAVPIFNEQGDVVEWFGSAVDITSRKMADQALRESEERFFKVFNNSPEMFAVVRISDQRYLEVNHKFLELTQYTRDEVVGRSVKEVGLWAESVSFKKDLLQTLNTKGEVTNIEVRFRTKSGRIFPVLLSSVKTMINKEWCRLHFARDMSREKALEADIARLDRLNLIGEMAASIGHEIRNPMTSVRGFLQLLGAKDEYRDDQAFFELMIEELDRANAIISEYLNMAKDKNINLQSQYLNPVIKAIYPIIEADANLREIKVELNLKSAPKVLIDKNEIRQLILNMARNGLEAMTNRGLLTIGTKRVPDSVILYVRDEGSGLAPEVLEKLGTPFVSTKNNGTGLGLAVCYSIAARHKATIDLETGSSGTTFYVKFPLSGEQEVRTAG